MRINPISFKSGLLYRNGVYINPDTVKMFYPEKEDKNKTRVIFNDRLTDVFNVKNDTFAAAFINAKNTNDIIDISGESRE